MNRRIKIDHTLWPEMGHLSQELKKARAAAGLTLDQAGVAVGVPGDYIDSLEGGYNNPSIQFLCAYARVLKIPAGNLLPNQLLSPIRTREGQALQ
ncbi:MAG: helix-turn-helix transcriptional regulator [Nitrobacter sp.]|uniref:helix-turn-helix domain-containing protein n=1 Tax=Nitrobacter sp. TaxID=29420 RepID=UPI0026395A37|nr:helix-turn-helix transcriptional regulator [Nitrobacter sp.]MCV0388051.1 helix-turn-helix transcriptional regulator [Nitrobacter sp.]